jgi:hypothetical protein
MVLIKRKPYLDRGSHDNVTCNRKQAWFGIEKDVLSSNQPDISQNEPTTAFSPNRHPGNVNSFHCIQIPVKLKSTTHNTTYKRNKVMDLCFCLLPTLSAYKYFRSAPHKLATYLCLSQSLSAFPAVRMQFSRQHKTIN